MEGLRRQEEGARLAIRNDPLFHEAAMAALTAIAARPEEFTADDLRLWLENAGVRPRHANSIGAAVRAAVRAGVMRRVGFQVSERAKGTRKNGCGLPGFGVCSVSGKGVRLPETTGGDVERPGLGSRGSGAHGFLDERKWKESEVEEDKVRKAARALGRLGGLKGGPARARAMSPEDRVAQATVASRAAAVARKRRAQERRAARDATEGGAAMEAGTA